MLVTLVTPTFFRSSDGLRSNRQALLLRGSGDPRLDLMEMIP